MAQEWAGLARHGKQRREVGSDASAYLAIVVTVLASLCNAMGRDQI